MRLNGDINTQRLVAKGVRNSNILFPFQIGLLVYFASHWADSLCAGKMTLSTHKRKQTYRNQCSEIYLCHRLRWLRPCYTKPRRQMPT